MIDEQIRNEYPFKDNFLNLRGFNYHYVDEGEGDPIIMVHGNPTWSFYFRNLIKELKGNYRTIAPDHIGCGLSDKPTDEEYQYTLENRVKDLEDLIDHLGITKNITLVLHDWGGMIGMAYAVKHPEKIKRLVIANTSAFFLPESKSFPWTINICRNTPLGPLLVRGANAFSLYANKFCATRRPLSKVAAKAYLAPYNNWNNRRAVMRFVEDIPLKKGDISYNTVAHVENNLDQFNSIPMLILWGAKDFVFDDHFLAKWKNQFPNAEIHRFADAGHYILEDAIEDIIPLVNKFLSDNPIN